VCYSELLMIAADPDPVNACLGAETFLIDAGWLDPSVCER
jgi:hypothetical protein